MLDINRQRQSASGAMRTPRSVVGQLSRNGAHNQADKLQPHNIEAEQAIIGAVLIDIDAMLRIDDKLSAEMFFLDRHRQIYRGIHNLWNQQVAIDLVTLADEVERIGGIDDEPFSILDGFIENTPTSIHVIDYAKIVRHCYLLRLCINGATKIVELAHRKNAEVDQILELSEQTFLEISKVGVGGDATRLSKSVDDENERIDDIQKRGITPGLPTGLKDMDKLLTGLQRSDLIVVAGRPGMGKTSLALNIALHAAKIGRAPLVFSMEMSESQLTQRLIAAESGIPSQRLRLGEIANDEWPAYGKAVGELSKHKLLIDDTPALSVMELKTKARREHARLSNGLNLIVVDYIQLMRGDGKSETRHQEVSYISRSLKGLARELNVPILALSQLSRKCESRHDKRPMLSDLAESGTIEQAADIIMFIYRDEIYNPDTEFPNIAEIIVGKHRHGPTGIFSTYFKKAITQFCDLEVRTQPLNY